MTQKVAHHQWQGVIAAYRDRLPVGDDWTPVTLFEGGTPLVPAPRVCSSNRRQRQASRGC